MILEHLGDAYRAPARTGDAAHAYHRALVAEESDEGVAAGKARRAALEGKLRESHRHGSIPARHLDPRGARPLASADAGPLLPVRGGGAPRGGFLNASDHLRLYWQRYTPPSPRATVALLHGGGDHSGCYPGLTSALVRAGFQVALLDLRGHGQSDGRRWHVDAFGDYVSDLSAFVAKLRGDGIAGSSSSRRTARGAHRRAVGPRARARGGRARALLALVPARVPPPAAKLLVAKIAGRIVPWLPVSSGLDVADLTSDPELQRWTDRDPLYPRHDAALV